MEDHRLDANHPNLSGLEVLVRILPLESQNALFGPLNLGDVRCLRMCNRRLWNDAQLRGVESRPLGPTRRLQAQCETMHVVNGQLIACTAGPLTLQQIKYCESHEAQFGVGPREICRSCRIDQRPALEDLVNDTVRHIRAGVCKRCCDDIVRQDPGGRLDCRCEYRMNEKRRRWNCTECCEGFFFSFLERADDTMHRLRRTHSRMDRVLRQKRTVVDGRVRRNPVCQRCNRSYRVRQEQVKMCLACNEIHYRGPVN